MSSVHLVQSRLMISEGEVIIDRNPAAAPAVETIEPANPLRDAQIAFKLRELASAKAAREAFKNKGDYVLVTPYKDSGKCVTARGDKIAQLEVTQDPDAISYFKI